jgi:hypothetical protein
MAASRPPLLSNPCTSLVVMLLGTLLAGGPALAQSSIPGQFAVSPVGAATYAIPIQVPPGVAGMEPKIALALNSRGGNGPLGVGWSLSGLSAISRCPRTTPQDGVKGAVGYDSNDRFCLDGRRLILVAGTEGADGAEYRTEVDTFSKVAVVGSASGGGPASFVVKTRSGLTLEYGNTSDSAVEVAGVLAHVVRVWAVNRISDAYGNTQTVSYSQPNSGEFYPDHIDYTSNGITGLASTNSVVFAYGARTDTLSGYQDGQTFQTTKRLTSITTKADGAAVSIYTPTYEYGVGGRSRIKSISLCTSAGVCAPQTHFSFKDSGVSTFDVVDALKQTDLLGTGPRWQALDLNGDGRTDLVRHPNATGNYAVWISQVDGRFASEQRSTTIDPDFTLGSWKVIDVDGDANADLIHFKDASGNYSIWRSLGDGTFDITNVQAGATDRSLTTGTWLVADVDGDGLADLLHMIGAEARVWKSNGNGTFTISKFTPTGDISPASGEWEVMDLNADGLADLFHRGPTTSKYGWLSNGDGTFTVFPVASYVEDPNNAGIWRQIDMNGDGLVDLVHLGCSGHSACVWLMTGNAYSQKVLTFDTTTDPTDTATGVWQVLDTNGDGLPDLVHAFGQGGLGEYYIWESDGKGGFGSIVSSSLSNDSCSSSCTLTKAGDFQGNGMPGFVRFDTDRYLRSIWLLGSGSLNIPSAIYNGVGGRTAWSLYTLPQILGTNYFKEVPNDAVAATIVPAVPVVLTVEVNPGWPHSDSYVGLDRTTYYAYGSARLERNGRGFVGFEWISSRDVQTGLVERTYFRQDFPYTGLVARHGRGSGGNLDRWGNLGIVTNTLGCVHTHPATLASCTVAPGKHYFPYVSQAVEQRADLDGSKLPGSKVVNSSIDSHGNVRSVATSILNPDGTATEYSKLVTNTFYNDPSKWVLGLLVKSVVSSTSPTIPAVVIPGSGNLPPAPPPVVPTLSNVAFGSVSIGGSSVATSTLANTGETALSLTVPNAASVSGADFSFVSTTCTSSLAKGATCTISVKFQPSVRGTRSGTLSVAVKDGTLTATLSGTGLGSQIAVTANAASSMSAVFGAAPATGVVTFSNTGNQSAVLSMAGLTAPYSVSPASCTAAASSSCSVTVSMSTSGNFGAQGNQNLTAMGGTNGAVSAGVSGTITGGSISVLTNNAGALSAASGAAPATGTVVFKNAGTQAATLNMSGLSSPYSVAPVSCAVAANGGTCSVTVSMATSGPVGPQGVQSLKALGGDVGAAIASVSGTVLGSAIAVTTNNASALVATKGGANAIGTVVFTNSGNQAAALSMSGLTAPYSVSPASCNAAAGGTCTVTVTMSSAGSIGGQGVQTLKATGGTNGVVSAPVSGTINGSSISVTANTATALSANKGGSPVAGSVTFANGGNQAAPLVMSGLSGAYSVAPTSCNVAAGASCSVTVTMATSGNVGSQGSQSLTATGGTTGTATASVAGTLHGSVATLTNAAAQTFATVNKGATPPQASWAFKNSGDLSMSLAVSTLNSPFSVLSNSCANVSAGATCSIVVAESTGTAGTYSQSGIVLSGPSQGSRSDLALSGKVNALAVMSATPNDLAFGTVRPDSFAQLTTTIKNTSTFAVSGLSRLIAYTFGSDQNGTYSSLSTCGPTLAAGATCTVTVTYSSDCTSGLRRGTMTLFGSNAEDLEVTLHATTGIGGCK